MVLQLPQQYHGKVLRWYYGRYLHICTEILHSGVKVPHAVEREYLYTCTHSQEQLVRYKVIAIYTYMIERVKAANDTPFDPMPN